MFFWIDSIVSVIQYGGRTKMCSDLMNKNSTEQFNIILKIVK
jgi:hypothetical protein